MTSSRETSTPIPGIKTEPWSCRVRSEEEMRDLRKNLLSWCLKRELSDQEVDRVSVEVRHCGIGKDQQIEVGDQAVNYHKWIGLGSVSESWKTSSFGRGVVINRRARPLGLTTVTYIEAVPTTEAVPPVKAES